MKKKKKKKGFPGPTYEDDLIIPRYIGEKS